MVGFAFLAAVLVILFFFIFMFWPAVVAGQNGRRRNMENAWIYGFALSWIGVMVVNSRSLPEPPPAITPYRESTQQTKICPRCAETVRAAATPCHFCGHVFSETTGTQAMPSKPS